VSTSPSALPRSAATGTDAKHARVSFLVLRRSRRDVPQRGDACRRWAATFHSLQAASGAFRASSHQPIDDLIFRWSLRRGAPRQEHTGSCSNSMARTRGGHQNWQTPYESERKESASRRRNRLGLQAATESGLTGWRPSGTRSAAFLWLVGETGR
jgi:hypothetical protein